MFDFRIYTTAVKDKFSFYSYDMYCINSIVMWEGCI